jgi:hypothetical protein
MRIAHASASQRIKPTTLIACRKGFAQTLEAMLSLEFLLLCQAPFHLRSESGIDRRSDRWVGRLALIRTRCALYHIVCCTCGPKISLLSLSQLLISPTDHVGPPE